MQKSLGKIATAGAAWSVVGNVGNAILQFAVFLFLARLLTPEIFGLVAYASSFIAFAQIFTEVGMSTALIQRLEVSSVEYNTVFWFNLGSSIVMITVFWSVAPLFAVVVGSAEIVPVIRALSLIFILQALTITQVVKLKRNLQFGCLVRRDLFSAIIGGGVGLVMAFNGAGVWSLVAKQLVQSLVGAFVIWRTVVWLPKLEFSLDAIRHLLSFGGVATANRVLTQIVANLFTVVVGSLAGASAAGVFSVATRLCAMINKMILSVSGSIGLSAFSRVQDDEARFSRGFQKAGALLSIVSFPIFLGMASAGRPIVTFVFGEEWNAAVPVFSLYALIGVAGTINYLGSAAMLAKGKPTVLLRLNSVTSLSKLALFCVGLQAYSLEVATAAVVVVEFLYLPVRVYVYGLETKLSASFYALYAVRPFLASLGMAMIVYAIFCMSSLWSDGFHVLILIVIGLFAYIALSWGLNRSGLEELKEAVQQIIFSKRNKANAPL